MEKEKISDEITMRMYMYVIIFAYVINLCEIVKRVK